MFNLLLFTKTRDSVLNLNAHDANKFIYSKCHLIIYYIFTLTLVSIFQNINNINSALFD